MADINDLSNNNDTTTATTTNTITTNTTANTNTNDKQKDDEHLYIHLKLINQDRKEEYFRIKRTTQFGKVFDTYCSRHGLTASMARFFYESNKVIRSRTPEDLGLENGAEIEVYHELVHGGGLVAVSFNHV